MTQQSETPLVLFPAMSVIQLPQPRVHSSITLHFLGKGRNLQQLTFHEHKTALLFVKDTAVAAYSGSIVYFNCNPGAEQRVVNEWYPNEPHVRSPADQFDFITGQILTSAGLPLTRKETDK